MATILDGMQNLAIGDDAAPVEEDRMITLNNIIQHYYDTQGLHDPQKKEKIKACLASIRQLLLDASLPLASMMNYGSAVNGFGSNKSDLDITIKVSLRLEEGPSGDILQRVKEILLASDGNCEAEYISARVPVVTAFYKGFEIDISYDNETAVQNTKLLKAYGNWEPRLLILGFFVKKWAKAYGICDGRNGFFKSYHWIILTINYLQKIGKKKRGKNIGRVVPYIQYEFWPGQRHERPWRFFEPEAIPNWSTNNSSVTELFLGFLKYYESFQFKTQVIHILSSKSVARRKYEVNHPVCIRDPFFRGHSAYRHLPRRDKKYYDQHYGGPTEQNIARAVTQENLDKIQKAMKTTASQISGYLGGAPMIDPILKALFNL